MTAFGFSVKCSKCHMDMIWYKAGIASGYWKCPECTRTTGGIGHQHQSHHEVSM